MIVGLAGYAGAGKDAAGAAFVHQGFTRRAFADPLKDIALRIGWDGAKDDTGRRLLQDLGVAAREVLGPDVWVNAALADLPPDVVVTDVRFPNEARAIQELGGRLVLVTRPGLGPVNDHVSETLPAIWDFDHELVNDGSLLDLRRSVYDFLGIDLHRRPGVRRSLDGER